MDDIFKALADPNRRRLLDRLNERNGQTLRELCGGLEMTRQSVSKHLAVLEAANLVSVTWQGREKLHFLNPAPINAIADRWMTRFDRQRATALADLTYALEQRHMDTSFVYVTYIKTTPEQLWSALTEPEFTKRYWGMSLISDWNVGSTITWEVGDVTIADDEQVVLAADPPRTLSYTWHTVTPEFIAAMGDNLPFLERAATERRTQVTFGIEPAGETVKLTVTHESEEPNSTMILEGVSNGWPSVLASLKSLLETGEPLSMG